MKTVQNVLNLKNSLQAQGSIGSIIIHKEYEIQ